MTSMRPLLTIVATGLIFAGGMARGADAPNSVEATMGADAAAPNQPPAKPALPPTLDGNGYLQLGFEHLASFTFTPPAYDPAADPKEKPKVTGEEQIPTEVKAWSGKKVAITGYMVPVKMDKGLVTEFLLMRNTMACCFGGTPSMNEWVIVRMKKGVPPMMDLPVAFYGELKVGALFENGYMTGLYEMTGERMGEVQG